MASYYGQGQYGLSSYRKDASAVVVISPSAAVSASAVILKDASSTITAAPAIPAVSAIVLVDRTAALTPASSVSATAALVYNVSITISPSADIPTVRTTGVGSSVVLAMTPSSSLTCILQDKWQNVVPTAGSWLPIYVSPQTTYVPVELLSATWTKQSLTT